MDDEAKRKVARLVAGIVVIDDDLDPEEDTFMTKLLARFGISDQERAEVIFPIVDAEEAAAALSALSRDIRSEAIQLVVEAAAADGKIVPEERAYLDALAKAAGLGADELDALIRAAGG